MEGNFAIKNTAVLDLQMGVAGDTFGSVADKKTFTKDLPQRVGRTRGRVDMMYHHLTNEEAGPMKMPKETMLYKFLKGYFQFAGGVYVSNPMGASRASKIKVVKDAGLSMHGPFHRNKLVGRCEGLGNLADWLDKT